MIIDGINISTTYKAILLEGSLDSLVAYPPLKKPKINNWAEENGLEVDLVAPVLNIREVELMFLIEASYIESFITFLLFKTYRTYISNDLVSSHTLRCVGISDINKPQGICSITIKLVDDFPLNGFSYVEPFLSTIDTGFTMDGKNMSQYGLVVLDGTESSLDRFIQVKPKLSISNNTTSGAVTSEQQSKQKERSGVLYLGIRQTVPNFWKGYNAFLYDLVKPSLRTLEINGNTYSFYYVSANVTQLIIHNDEVWCTFNVKINVL